MAKVIAECWKCKVCDVIRYMQTKEIKGAISVISGIIPEVFSFVKCAKIEAYLK